MIDSKLGSSDSSDSTCQGGGESDEISSEDFSDSDNVPAALESMYDSAIEVDNYNDSFEKTEMIIEEERQKLLREHAHKLIGFLPTGILSIEDMERLGQDDLRFLYKPNTAASPMTALEEKFAPKTNY